MFQVYQVQCHIKDVHHLGLLYDQIVLLSSTGTTVILAYLNEKNRPYSAQDVFCNLQKQHGLGKTVRIITVISKTLWCVCVAYK